MLQNLGLHFITPSRQRITVSATARGWQMGPAALSGSLENSWDNMGRESRCRDPLHNPHCIIKFKCNSYIKGDFQNEDGEGHGEALPYHEIRIAPY